jgi:hypothetical protein
MNRILGVVTVAVLAVAVTACSDSSGPDTPPGLDRIDGPAQVDPSFDPFATTPSDPPRAADDGG